MAEKSYIPPAVREIRSRHQTASVGDAVPNQVQPAGVDLQKKIYVSEGYKQSFIDSIGPVARAPLMAVGPGIFTGIFLNLALPYFALRFMNETNKSKVKLPGKPDQYTKDSHNYGAAQTIFEGALNASWDLFVKKPYSFKEYQSSYENLYHDHYVPFAEKNPNSTKDLADRSVQASKNEVSTLMI